MTDLRLMTVADMAEACAYIAARYHAALTYDCPTWRILAPSGRIHEGFSLAEAVAWYELREPEHVPDTCSVCSNHFTFSNPWVYEGGAFLHAACIETVLAEIENSRLTDAAYRLEMGARH